MWNACGAEKVKPWCPAWDGRAPCARISEDFLIISAHLAPTAILGLRVQESEPPHCSPAVKSPEKKGEQTLGVASAKGGERGAGQGRARGQGICRSRKSRPGKARARKDLVLECSPSPSRAGSPHWGAPSGLGALNPSGPHSPGPWVSLDLGMGPHWESVRHQWVRWGHIPPQPDFTVPRIPTADALRADHLPRPR